MIATSVGLSELLIEPVLAVITDINTLKKPLIIVGLLITSLSCFDIFCDISFYNTQFCSLRGSSRRLYTKRFMCPKKCFIVL
jgi:hypothetical protein